MTKEEFKICFDQWFDPIRSFVYYRCGDPDRATDIVQEAFMKIWEKDVFYHPQQTKALLYKVAKELWISQHRKLQTARKYQLSVKEKPESNLSENGVEFEELKEKYEKALANLPEKQRTVFLMSRLEECTYKEIAERLGLSVKAIEKRMKLALQQLRKELDYGT